MKHFLIASAIAIIAGVCFLKACEAQQRLPYPSPYQPDIQAPTPYVNPYLPPQRPYQPPTVYVPPSGQRQCMTINEVTYCTK